MADVGDTVLADTVGFIRHLPHDLVAAFKATLQETRQASLLLHIIDAADPRVAENMAAVDTVLAEIEADEIPTLLVMNKLICWTILFRESIATKTICQSEFGFQPKPAQGSRCSFKR